MRKEKTTTEAQRAQRKATEDRVEKREDNHRGTEGTEEQHREVDLKKQEEEYHREHGGHRERTQSIGLEKEAKENHGAEGDQGGSPKEGTQKNWFEKQKESNELARLIAHETSPISVLRFGTLNAVAFYFFIFFQIIFFFSLCSLCLCGELFLFGAMACTDE